MIRLDDGKSNDLLPGAWRARVAEELRDAIVLDFNL
jgi:hypothetical protein